MKYTNYFWLSHPKFYPGRAIDSETSPKANPMSAQHSQSTATIKLLTQYGLTPVSSGINGDCETHIGEGEVQLDPIVAAISLQPPPIERLAVS